MTRRIEVVPYDPIWPCRFQLMAEEITATLGEEVMSIHHIGSTAIPGISAKPIIDVVVEVRAIGNVDAFNEEIVLLGYVPKGEYGIPGRRFFIRGPGVHRTGHLHVYQAGHPRVKEHLDFRDYMIAHPDDAAAYSLLKEDLADRYAEDIDSYTAGKDRMIKAAIEKVKVWREHAPRS